MYLEDQPKFHSEGSQGMSLSLADWWDEAILKSQDSFSLLRSQSISNQPGAFPMGYSTSFFPFLSSEGDGKPLANSNLLPGDRDDTAGYPPRAAARPGPAERSTSQEWITEYQVRPFADDRQTFEGSSNARASQLRADWNNKYNEMLPPAELPKVVEVPQLVTPKSLKKTVPVRKPVKTKAARPVAVLRRPTSREYVDPTEDDVLMGRGGRANLHPGNQRYLKEKERLRPEYLTTEKNKKHQVSQQLVDIVHAWKGRFVKKEEGSNRWYVVDNEEARKKASQALREENSEASRQQKRKKYPAPKKNQRRHPYQSSDSDDSYCDEE